MGSRRADNSNMMKRSAGPQEILLRVFLPGVVINP